MKVPTNTAAATTHTATTEGPGSAPGRIRYTNTNRHHARQIIRQALQKQGFETSKIEWDGDIEQQGETREIWVTVYADPKHFERMKEMHARTEYKDEDPSYELHTQDHDARAEILILPW